MLILIEILIFLAIAGAAYFFMSVKKAAEKKPLGLIKENKAGLEDKRVFVLFAFLAAINKPFPAKFKEDIYNRIAAAKIKISVEELLLIKELLIIGLLVFFFPFLKTLPPTALLIPVVGGYMLPDMFLKTRISKFKKEITKSLPDAIDLLSLCVGAGLDFMLAIKWVVEKSYANLLIEELKIVMREINMGKQRKLALIDLAKRYDIEELSTFSRSLVQADRMGTSIADALNILSEDMRLARFRRGEQAALKAPIKMLIPLLFFIFPVVWVIVGGPIILQFLQSGALGAIKY